MFQVKVRIVTFHVF